LTPGGTLLIEAGEQQAEASAALFAAAGLLTRVDSDHDVGATVVLAVAPR
jgi:release factor glutamine methyltransferase